MSMITEVIFPIMTDHRAMPKSSSTSEAKRPGTDFT